MYNTDIDQSLTAQTAYMLFHNSSYQRQNQFSVIYWNTLRLREGVRLRVASDARNFTIRIASTPTFSYFDFYILLTWNLKVFMKRNFRLSIFWLSLGFLR